MNQTYWHTRIAETSLRRRTWTITLYNSYLDQVSNPVDHQFLNSYVKHTSMRVFSCFNPQLSLHGFGFRFGEIKGMKIAAAEVD